MISGFDQYDERLDGPVPDGEDLLRVAIPSMDGKITPEAFVLSSDDKAQNPPRLSVFAASLTTPNQAWQIMDRKPAYSVVGYLRSEHIRSIRAMPETEGTLELDVRWDRIDSALPGATGHAGLLGLSGAHRRFYRAKLADLANQRGVKTLDKLIEG